MAYEAPSGRYLTPDQLNNGETISFIYENKKYSNVGINSINWHYRYIQLIGYKYRGLHFDFDGISKLLKM